MSKKKRDLIENLENLDPEKEMPLPERLRVETPTATEEPVEASPSPSEPEIKASGNKQPEVVEPGYFSTKVERYRR